MLFSLMKCHDEDNVQGKCCRDHGCFYTCGQTDYLNPGLSFFFLSLSDGFSPRKEAVHAETDKDVIFPKHEDDNSGCPAV